MKRIIYLVVGILGIVSFVFGCQTFSKVKQIDANSNEALVGKLYKQKDGTIRYKYRFQFNHSKNNFDEAEKFYLCCSSDNVLDTCRTLRCENNAKDNMVLMTKVDPTDPKQDYTSYVVSYDSNSKTSSASIKTCFENSDTVVLFKCTSRSTVRAIYYVPGSSQLTKSTIQKQYSRYVDAGSYAGGIWDLPTKE